MPIREGDTLPDATLVSLGAEGPEQVAITDKLAGRKVVIFGLPGAYTNTCTSAHMPSFIRTADRIRDRGVAEIICVAVNDPFVMGAWAKDTGADAAGITMLADARAELTRGIDMAFTAPPVGFFDRSKRYAMVVDDGRVMTLHVDENPGTCDTTAGEAILETL